MMNKEKAIKDCEIKISDECFKINELCKTFKTAESKKFKGIERYREMIKISELIAATDERIWNLYEKIPDESKLKKEKIVFVARDEAMQVKEIMENEEDPRKRYMLSYNSQQFNSWGLQSTPRISRSVSTMHFNQSQQSANTVGTSSELTASQGNSGPILKKSCSSPNLIRVTIPDAVSTSDSVEINSDFDLSNYFEAEESDTSNDSSIFSTPNVPQRSDMDENSATESTIEIDGADCNINIQLGTETLNKCQLDQEEETEDEETEEEGGLEDKMNTTFLASESTVPYHLIQQVENYSNTLLAATNSDNINDQATYNESDTNDINSIPHFELNESSRFDNTNDEESTSPTQAEIFKKISTPRSTMSESTTVVNSVFESQDGIMNGVQNETELYCEISNGNTEFNPNQIVDSGLPENQNMSGSKIYESNSKAAANSDNFSDLETYNESDTNDINSIFHFELIESTHFDNTSDDEESTTPTQSTTGADSSFESQNGVINGIHEETNFYVEISNENTEVVNGNQCEFEVQNMSDKNIKRPISPQLSLEFLSGSNVKRQGRANINPVHHLGYLSHSAMYLIHLIGQSRPKTTLHI